jgi:quercetin dioxygenase-like cupin family protein
MADMFAYLEQLEKEVDSTTFSTSSESDGYIRHLLKKTSEFEVYCIVWNKGAETPFHGHPDGGCWMRVITGQLHEVTMGGERTLRVGDTGFQKGPYGIHKIWATEASRSLHLYKPGRVVSDEPVFLPT